MSKPKEYRLVALSVGALGNKVFHKGDGQRIFEGNFEPGHAEELVKKGFLEPVDEDEEAGEEPAYETPYSEVTEEPVDEEELVEYLSKCTVKELKKMLDDRGIVYPPNAAKQYLLDLLK